MKLKQVYALTLVCGLISLPVLTSAQQDKDPVIDYRQNVMHSIAANISAIGDILKHSLPQQQNIAVHANQMREAASLIPSAFEQNVSEGLTDAKPAVWEEWEEFEDYAGDLESASAKLAEVAEGGDVGAMAQQVKQVGDTCKQCHDEFRKPKEESYKKRM